ncbi:uncharacterized protein PGTG_00649 [Puccinia graminis f. sp. tritici CRL 75-36-700-3]|uniref:Uncharacterized protein n=1 Tax=Puccinia graminis f. sp. tritici (strain CRL 75-36-700-3 / race SCCL) TaxID=418459 RepID=E3JQP4_PUCGT|nr:uncharacterized protein PGTG_00649 [Puccinia graminis f. sp. tritici CRL 75-36-700-3]EFP74693.2 hypothetical protein PGTG_00649 [Puccinia graminis f. sp. tritici CRL 75-36-700-3]
MVDPIKQPSSNTLGDTIHQEKPPPSHPVSLHRAPEKPTTTTKRPNASLPSPNMDASGSANKLEPASNKLRKIADIKPTIPQGPAPKMAASTPAVLSTRNTDKAQTASASLRSMKFKKKTPHGTEKPKDTAGPGASRLVNASASQNKDGPVIKKELETGNDQQAASQNQHKPYIVKTEPDMEDSKEWFQAGSKHPITSAPVVGANRAGDEAAATPSNKRCRETDSAEKRLLPDSGARTALAGPGIGSSTRSIWPSVQEPTSDSDKLFSRFFEDKVRTLSSPLPLTIFNPKWQRAALSYEARQRAEGEASSENDDDGDHEGLFYYGYPYPDEILQDFKSWTLNHRNFHATLRDVYQFEIFAEWMLKHKANADRILDVHGFMVALRYDIQVRANAFAFRVISEQGDESVSDVSILRKDIEQEAYSKSRHLNELGYEDNPYLLGGARHAYHPQSGKRDRPANQLIDSSPIVSNYDFKNRYLNRANSHDRFARNPRYFGNSYIPNFVYDKNKNININGRRASGSGSNS